MFGNNYYGEAYSTQYFTENTLDIPKKDLAEIQNVIGTLPDGMIGIASIRAMCRYIYKKEKSESCNIPWYCRY